MNINNAIELSKSTGLKVTHPYFSENEWVRFRGFTASFEDGASIDVQTFINDREGMSEGWELIYDRDIHLHRISSKISNLVIVGSLINKDNPSEVISYLESKNVLQATEITTNCIVYDGLCFELDANSLEKLANKETVILSSIGLLKNLSNDEKYINWHFGS